MEPDDMIEQLLEKEVGTTWEKSFLNDIYGLDSLSDAQEMKLKEIYYRYI